LRISNTIKNDRIYGKCSHQATNGFESIAAEHPNAVALADTSQKTSSDHRKDLVQGDVQRYGFFKFFDFLVWKTDNPFSAAFSSITTKYHRE